MAETSPDQSPTRSQPQSGSPEDTSHYWCYHCDKRVAVETLSDLPDVICFECKNGFVESISAAAVATSVASESIQDTALGDQLMQVLRLIAQTSREEDAPPPSDPSEGDYLPIEIDVWGNENHEEEDEEEEEADDDNDDEHSVEVVHEEEADNRERSTENIRSDGEDEEEIEVIETRDEEEEEEDLRRRRRGALRIRLSDFASRAASRRNRILDWAEILMGLEDHSIELRLQVPDSDTYVGNPGDYVDAAGYETLLQNLAESDSGAGRGAPPASKAAVEALKSVVIGEEESVTACAICKDLLNVGEVAKTLPCDHGYHSECIIPWLGSRNTCPVCRFELPTDDADYEEERKKRVAGVGLKSASSSSSAAGAAAGDDGGDDDYVLQ